MPAIPITTPPPPANPTPNPLPPLLQTPSGLALLELQGMLNSTLEISPDENLPVGRLEFPLYDAAASAKDDTAWQKRVHLYVGRNQRLTGEVKKLPLPVALLRRVDGAEGMGELEVREIVYWKVIFGSRPEPVGSVQTV
ncbi:hypothetical protein Q7P37_003575 [Cladosporium fusiforme]